MKIKYIISEEFNNVLNEIGEANIKHYPYHHTNRDKFGSEYNFYAKGNLTYTVIIAYKEIMSNAIKEEFERHQILIALEDESKSVKTISSELEIDPSIVLEHMLILKSRAQVDFQEIIKNTPIYMRV